MSWKKIILDIRNQNQRKTCHLEDNRKAEVEEEVEVVGEVIILNKEDIMMMDPLRDMIIEIRSSIR